MPHQPSLLSTIWPPSSLSTSRHLKPLALLIRHTRMNNQYASSQCSLIPSALANHQYQDA